MNTKVILFTFLGCVVLPSVFSTQTPNPPNNPPAIQILKILSNSSIMEKQDVLNKTQSVIFNQDLSSVELHCSSSYPVKWEFIYKGISLPSLDVHYKRILMSNISSSDSSLEDLKVQANNHFLGVVTLNKLLQFQTGRYVCSHYNSKLLNNSQGSAAQVDVFVPGNITFYEVSHVKYINSSVASNVIIPCTVTDPSVQVRLYRLNEHIYKLRRQHVWKRVEGGRYDPMVGFVLQGGLGRSLIGDYNCSSGNSHIVISVHDVSDKASVEALGVREPCWEQPSTVKMLRSTRLECFCRDSYALFTTEDEELNRKGNCPSGKPSLGNETAGNVFQKCWNDWRALEFLEAEESKRDDEVCYRDNIREGLNGTGTRFFLRVNGQRKPDGRLNLTVHYDGFPTWASGFKLAVGNGEGENVVLLRREPTRTQMYPLAQYTAVWENVEVGKHVTYLHVLQPLPHAFEWFKVVQDLTKITFEDEVKGFHQSANCGISCNQSMLVYCMILGLIVFYSS